jgi:hypothetical protein
MPPWELQSARAGSVRFVFPRATRSCNSFRGVGRHASANPLSRRPSHLSQIALYATQAAEEDRTPRRKQLKDERKAKRAVGLHGTSSSSTPSQEKLKEWEVTVGIEIHAQLNTARKLFSRKHSARIALSELTPGRRSHLYQ